MSTQVISIRATPQTVAKCYLLLQQAGGNPVNMPVGRAVGKILSGIVDIVYKQSGLPDVATEQQAATILKRYLPTSEFSFVNVEAIREGLRTAVSTASEYVPVGSETHRTENTDNIEERRKNVAEYIESIAQRIEEQEEQELRNSVSVGKIERESVDEEAVEKPRQPPWELSSKITEEEARTTIAYSAAAKDKNELLMLAVRVTYAGIPSSMWDTAPAMNAIASTYQIFKKYKEADNG